MGTKRLYDPLGVLFCMSRDRKLLENYSTERVGNLRHVTSTKWGWRGVSG